MNNLEKKEKISKRDKALCLPLFWYSVLTVYTVFGRSIITIPKMYLNIIRYGVTVALFIFSSKHFTKKAFRVLCAVGMIFFISYAYSIMSGNMTNEIIFEYCVQTLLLCIPSMVTIISVDNPKSIYFYLYKSTIFNIVMLIFFLVFNKGEAQYNMAASYQLLFCVTFQLNEFNISHGIHKVIHILVFVVGTSLILIYGARGPLLCLIIYTVLLFLIENRLNAKTLFLFILIVAGILLIMFKFNIILRLLIDLLDKYELHSRTLNQLLQSEILNDSGRSYYRNITKEYINAKPLFGYGASSDVSLIGGYPHSFLLELMFDFGIPVGVLFYLTIVFIVISTLFQKRGSGRSLMIIFISTGFVMLFLSGTYLQNQYIFMLLGLTFRSDIKSLLNFGVKVRAPK